jgi:uncharacterized membrane protein
VIFLVVLALATLLAAVVLWTSGQRSARRAALLGMATAMVFAGVAHWLMPTPFVQHLPPWVPAAEALVLVTGVIEVGLGAALLLRQPWRRRRGGLALAAYFVAVFPANVYVAVADVAVDGQPGGWYPWLRTALPGAVHRLGVVEHRVGPPAVARRRCPLVGRAPRAEDVPPVVTGPNGEGRDETLGQAPRVVLVLVSEDLIRVERELQRTSRM